MMDTEQETSGLLKFLSKVGLEKFYPNKLTLRSLLEINKNSISDETVQSVEEIPWCFLRKLFKINPECRNCTQLSNNDDDDNDEDNDNDEEEDNKVNSLDLVVALFLCADSFLQQEIALKMSMCQFSVPLVLPHGNGSQSSLMLWALRDIVKEWCPNALSESRGFVEDNIIQAKVPLYSFVRLKNCSLSKSQCLNHVLSCGQQNNNMFIHRDMEGGALKRNIANGLVEVCWFLPSGKGDDIFPEPFALANLRGDICESNAQFNFLFQVSTATFVFLDKVEEREHKILTSLQDVKSKLFLVVNHNKVTTKEDKMSVETKLKELDLPKTSVKTKKSKENVAEFSKKLCATITTSLKDVKTTTSIVKMLDVAVERGLSVDERKAEEQKKAAEEIMDGIGAQTIPQYKKEQLPLQGENWKRLAQLEKEECRMTQAGVSGLEEYKSKLQEEKIKIWKEQSKQEMSKGMKLFIQTLSTSDKEKRDFFLKWMKFQFNTHSRDKLTTLRNDFKEQCKEKNTKLITELGQALMESSLGLEHYMREMGLIYEVSLQSPGLTEISRLPGVAAEMLLDGYPLELLDGDASNIPERWVKDVLMELHRKVGEKSRLLVLTVLGVQSTGKSTLLNTMFGVQFPVSSGRCTRGVFMLVLKVGEDIQSKLNFDFILLIDTEGLKSPDLAQLEDSFEHDNQLATFVIGLSDITIINIAMENSTEMKDVLQIAAHAFLRMTIIGKKPVCHFVHQNVAGVSAHTKNRKERQHLLDQLNDMTKIAAQMEKQSTIKAFTDVLDYDIEKNNWNIPGLWHGTPPMAPVNTGYSKAVADLKQGLLETVKRDGSNHVSQIPDFLERMKSLWKAVKYENFIFSYRNTLVAHAYNNLCKEFSQWEWEFRKEILSWQAEAETEILNADNESQVDTWRRLVESKKHEVSNRITLEQTKMKDKLSNYYKEKKDKHVKLIEKHKMEFFNSINSLGKEINHSVCNKLDCTLELKISSKKAQDIQGKCTAVIEEQVMKLLSDFKENSTLSDAQLKHEFDKMWAKATEDVPGLTEDDIPASILNQLRKHFSNSNSNQELLNIDIPKEIGEKKKIFKTSSDHVNSPVDKDLQSYANRVIETSTKFVLDKTKTNKDYHESFTRDLLEKIDESLKNCKHCETNTQFEIDLKLHICGIASREFLKMHQKFIKAMDPRIQLEKFKDGYSSDFIGLYKRKALELKMRSEKAQEIQGKFSGVIEEKVRKLLSGCKENSDAQLKDEFEEMWAEATKDVPGVIEQKDPKIKDQYSSDFIALYRQIDDDCKRKATHFVRLCIKPAAEEYISKYLGIEILDEIMNSHPEYSSRSFFQYNIQKELLEKADFESFVKYIQNYEIYVKDWIFQHIRQNMSEDKTLCKLKNKKLQIITDKITEAIKKATKGKDGNQLPDKTESITELINNMRKCLIKDISISESSEKSTLFRIQCTCHPFINSLNKSLSELKKQLQEEFSNSEDITETLSKLPIKPQEELFKRVFGCGQQCPFCKVPCEAEGKDHKQHHAAIHRPKGLGEYRYDATKKLIETLCTTDVQSERRFSNSDTKGKWHPYKDYTKYYPDWLIPPDPTIQASDYWKYILVQYNDKFAQEFNAKPADVPKAWRNITKKQALKGLKDAFNIE
ncbi:up-regulator of cell proliferation-like [Sebastes umbrosus]|uniref:up-regulator of cell proliferation-like n=1 Tax=Sebastes umbrosus TaxID=72105 RepID=UPI00189E1A59|nr:up-regulator of cell proliferation-like [Sebastes umbrosus]